MYITFDRKINVCFLDYEIPLYSYYMLYITPLNDVMFLKKIILKIFNLVLVNPIGRTSLKMQAVAGLTFPTLS